MSSLLQELKRRNVIKVAVLYIVTAWLVLQAGDVLFELLQLPEWSLRWVLGVMILGFPVVLVFSWIYELTPEGVKREKDIDRSQSITPDTGRKINAAILAGLAVAIGLMLYQQFTGHPGPAFQTGDTGESQVAETAEASPPPEPEAEAPPSVAVLPFVNMSPDPDQDYFADGLSDTLMHVLAQVRGLKVAARTSSFAFKGQAVNVTRIAEELGVAHVLEGSVQKSGNKLRVIAQLVDAADGSHVWSANFDRSLEDIFVIQDEIAEEVVKALRVTLLDEDQARIAERYQPTLEAYEQLILGRQQMAKRTAQSLDRAEQHFKQAIELDPDYALAYVSLADTYLLQNVYSGLVLERSIELRRPLIEKALELEPLSGEAHASRATLWEDLGKDEAAEADFLRAIELSPSYATAYQWYRGWLSNEGRFEEGLAQIRKAAELDPMAPIIQYNLSDAAWELGRVEEAFAVLRRIIRRHPEFPNAYRGMADYKRQLGQIGESLRWLDEAARLNPGDADNARCFALLNLANLPAAERCHDELERQHPGTFSTVFAGAVVDFYKRDLDSVVARMETLLERTPGNRFPAEVLAEMLARKGELKRARRVLVDTFPEFLTEEPELNATHINAALKMAGVLHGLGEYPQRDVVLTALESLIATMHRTRGGGYGITDVYIHQMRGDRERALTALREGIDTGWRIFWWSVVDDWKLGELTEDPEFIAVMTELEADIAEQRRWYEANKDQPLP